LLASIRSTILSKTRNQTLVAKSNIEYCLSRCLRIIQAFGFAALNAMHRERPRVRAFCAAVGISCRVYVKCLRAPRIWEAVVALGRTEILAGRHHLARSRHAIPPYRPPGRTLGGTSARRHTEGCQDALEDSRHARSCKLLLIDANVPPATR